VRIQRQHIDPLVVCHHPHLGGEAHQKGRAGAGQPMFVVAQQGGMHGQRNLLDDLAGESIAGEPPASENTLGRAANRCPDLCLPQPG